VGVIDSSATVLTSSCWLLSPNFLVWPRLLGIEKVDFNALDLVSVATVGSWVAGTDTLAGISGATNWDTSGAWL
jgi:hypothetical protein